MSKLVLVYLAIGISGVALLALGAGAAFKWSELFGQPQTAGPELASWWLGLNWPGRRQRARTCRPGQPEPQVAPWRPRSPPPRPGPPPYSPRRPARATCPPSSRCLPQPVKAQPQPPADCPSPPTPGVPGPRSRRLAAGAAMLPPTQPLREIRRPPGRRPPPLFPSPLLPSPASPPPARRKPSPPSRTSWVTVRLSQPAPSASRLAARIQDQARGPGPETPAARRRRTNPPGAAARPARALRWRAGRRGRPPARPTTSRRLRASRRGPADPAVPPVAAGTATPTAPSQPEPAPSQPEPAPSQPDPADPADPAAPPQPTAHAPEPAPATVDLQREVTVVPGVPRYHNPHCLLIRFMGQDDLDQMTLGAARQAGCTPCRACLPDQPELNPDL